MLDLYDRIRGFKDELPNKFSVYMGTKIREARIEANMSQGELAKTAYFRQAAISDIENGKREVTASELVYFSYALNKPILYFFPQRYITDIEGNQLSVLEQELLIHAKLLSNEDIRKLIAQIKAIAALEKKEYE